MIKKHRPSSAMKSEKLPEISNEQLIECVRYIDSLSFQAKSEIFDRIFLQQPHLLTQALVLSALDVPFEKIDHVLHLLLVFYLCFTDNERLNFPEIGEDEIVAADNDTIAMFQFFEQLDLDKRAEYQERSIRHLPEKNVMAFMFGYLTDHGFDQPNQANAQCIRSAKNIFDCFCKLKRDYGSLKNESGR